MKSFLKFIKEAKSIGYVVTFGRFNPPTIGHKKLIDVVAAEAKIRGFEYLIFPSRSVDKKKNPLPVDLKVDIMKKSYPQHSSNIVNDPSIKNVFDVATNLYNLGLSKGANEVDLVLVVGSDRIKEFDVLKKYNGAKARHGFYDFKSIEIISAGERDPDSDDVSGMSASKLRNYALINDFEKFKLGMSSSLSNADAKRVFDTIRKEMGHLVEDVMSKRKEYHPKTFHIEQEENKFSTEIDFNNIKIIEGYEEAVESAIVLQNAKKYIQYYALDNDTSNIVFESIGKLYRGLGTLFEGTEIDVPRTNIIKDFNELLENKKYTSLSSVKNKQHFFKYLADRKGISRKEAEDYVDELLKKQSAHLKRRASSEYGENDESRLDRILKTYWKETGQDDDSVYTKRYKEKFKTEEKVIKAVKNKSDETGVPYEILYQVYRRGMGAAKTSGTRPGMTPQQWALARINSFVTGGKTSKTTDADLYKKAKKYLKEEIEFLSEGMKFHLETNREITQNIYRPHTEKFYSLFVEARNLYQQGKYTPNSEFEEEILLSEAGSKGIYKGKEVVLDIPFRGGSKKFRVYTKNEKGNVIKIDFGDPNLSVKTQDSGAIKSFAARHNCDQKTDKTKAGYWACRLPKFQKELGLDFVGDPQWW